MAMNFTPEQTKVIETRDSSCLVSAAAGSGKTAVLTQRIADMVCDEEHPIDIDRLLVVTFTNAAAAEMRERIAAKITEKLVENPESEHVQRQSALIHNAQITTIDSFCLFLLRNHFNEIGLDPAFRIADEGEIKLMKQDTLKELLEDAFAAKEESFHHCVEYFCPGGKESVLEQRILDLHDYAASFPWPEKWLEERKKDYAADSVAELCDSDYGRYLLKHLQSMTSGWIQKMKQVQTLCQQPDGPHMYGELVDKELDALEKLEGCDNLEGFASKLPNFEFGRLPSKKDDSVSPVKRKLAGDMRGEVKESLQGISDKFFATPFELALEQSRACREPISALIDLTLEFQKRITEKKQDKKIIDFSDMEHLALDILLNCTEEEITPSAVAKEYRQYFEEIMIDEYQDSNLVQEYILAAVSGEEEGKFNRFMVGDVKQSIYKFRLARPELFLEKYDTYKESGEQIRIDLSKNFRSRVEVVDAVNQVFSRLMSKQVGGIEYDEKAALYPGAEYPEAEGNETELLLIQKPAKEDDLSAKQAEAKVIAGKIKELMKSFLVMEKETKEMRPVRYSDMVILLRTNSGWDEEFKAVLEQEGIPAFVTTKTGYFDATEVQELLQVLRVIDNPTQDIPLFGMLKSIFGGFTDREIAEIRSTNKCCSLYEVLKLANTDKTTNFLQKLAEYRKCSVYMSVRELLTKLVLDYDYLNYVTALPAGGKRRANVEMLFTRASDFEKTSYFGLFHFIRYIEQLEKYDVDYGEADTLDENADVVRIMSIHKSKGLEFPVTFVAALSKRFNMQDTNQALVMDMDYGIGVDYVDVERRLKNKTLRRNILARKLREDSLSEELRVLYVALTRAREKLILTGVTDKAAETWDSYREAAVERLTYSDFMEGSTYLDYLLPIMKHTGIAVTVVQAEEMAEEELTEQLEYGIRLERLQQADKLADGRMLQALQQRLQAEYSHKNLEGLYTKTTVSELKIAAMADKDEAAFHSFEEKEIQPYIPTFRREEEKISGAVRGNAYHRVMELMNWKKVLEGLQKCESYEDFREGAAKLPIRERMEAFLQEKLADGRLKKEYAEAVSLRRIIHFVTGELGFRMYRADLAGKLYCEQPFVLGISAERLGQEYPTEESVLIQGIIDVFFEEEDGLVLLDYKTDSVESMQELWKRYETQIDYYEEALQKLMNKPVKERILYSFHLEKF